MAGSRQRKSNLPADVTTFVGRQAELRRIRELLGETRLVSLVGVGGVGKTRLARAAARDLARTFSDGAWFVDLAAVHDGSFVEQAARDIVPGVRSAGSLTDQLADANLLVVLDDCEHVIDAVRALVSDLLPWCPAVHVLTTTRLPLGLGGEHLLTVPPLAVTAASGGEPSEAAMLFANRAEAATGAATAPHDAAAIDELCARLDGLPLAIELAATKARTMAVGDIIAGLDDRFGLLRGGPLDSHPRHQSLDAVLRWSWDQCDEAERDLWTQFSVFVGAVPVDAVVAVCGYQGVFEAHDVIDRLVQRSLVVSEGSDDGVRFRMLDMIREFGRRALEDQAAVSPPAATADVLRARLLSHYAAQVAEAEREWFGPRQREMSRRVSADMPNIRLAFDGALAEAEYARADALYADLWLYWVGSGQVNQGRAWAARLFDRLAEAGVQPSCRALWIRGWTGIIAGDIDDAVAQFDECLRRAPAEGMPQAAYMSRGLLGGCRAIRGDVECAFADYDVAIAQARDHDDAFGAALLLQNLAELHGTYGDCDRALALCDESAAICRDRGDEWCLSHVLWVRSLVGYRQERFDVAREQGLQALTRKAAMHDQLGVALAGEVLAWITAARDEHEAAAVMLGATDSYWRVAGCALLGLTPLIACRDACLAAIEDAIGADRLGAALAEGHQRGLTQIPGLAGEEADAPSAPTAGAVRRAPSTDPGALEALTRRELEVARLVGDGMTNKEIASTLVIGRRTVDTHVAHILAKLDCARRSEVARIMAQVGSGH